MLFDLRKRKEAARRKPGSAKTQINWPLNVLNHRASHLIEWHDY